MLISVMLIKKTCNVNKAPGIDKLSGIFIKDGAVFLAAPLTQIINLSISTSTFPDLCKIAKLRALFKKGSKTDPKTIGPFLYFLFSLNLLRKLSIYKPKNF